MRVAFSSLLVALTACSSTASAPDASFDGGDELADAGGSLHANGTVGPWQTLAPMPVARANSCAAVVGSFVVVIGGNFPDDGGFTKLDSVHTARFHDDGSLDAWQLAGHAPSPVTECTATGLGTTLFLVDGIYDDDTKVGHAFVVDLTAQGTITAPFVDVGPLPAGTDLFDDIAFANPGELYATTSQLAGTCDVLSTPLHGGAIPTDAAWSDAPFVSEFRGRPQWATATAGNALYVYVLGGYADADAGNAVLASGWGAPVVGGGAAFAVTALPQPTTFGTAAWADDFVFVIGGRNGVFGGTPTPTVISAQASATDGTLSAWTAQPPLPEGRTNVSSVVAGNFLYVLGGAGAAATDTVYAAQVRF
jgi:hypothetical protein